MVKGLLIMPRVVAVGMGSEVAIATGLRVSVGFARSFVGPNGLSVGRCESSERLFRRLELGF